MCVCVCHSCLLAPGYSDGQAVGRRDTGTLQRVQVCVGVCVGVRVSVYVYVYVYGYMSV